MPISPGCHALVGAAIMLVALPGAVRAQSPVRVRAAAQTDRTQNARAESGTAETANAPPEALPPVEGDHDLTLEDLQAMAQAGNPSLARAAALLQAARGNWVQAGLPPNPVVGYSGQQIGSRGLAEQDGVVINQEIITGGKLHLDRHVAEQDIFRAEREMAAQQMRVQTDVRTTFFQVLIAQRQIDTARQLMDLSQKAAKAAEDLFRADQTSRVDVLQARLEVNNARIFLQNASFRHRAAWQRLQAVVGNPQLPARALSGSVDADAPDITWQEALQRLQTASPEVAVAMANIERARWAYQRALVEVRPNISVQGLINARDNGIGGRSDGALQMTVPLPIWNRNQGRIAQASFEAAAAERALEQLELDLQYRLSPVFERYVSARNQVATYREEVLPNARETLDLVRQTYEAGEVGFVNLLTVQRTYSQTNFNYLESLRELRTAEAEIEGMLLSGSLQQR